MYVPLLLWLIAIQDLGPKAEDVAVTLNGFSQIVNADLARDLGPDVVKMLTHSRAHIRKRAIVALYGVLTKHPELTSTALPRLRERLEDNDPGKCLFGSVDAETPLMHTQALWLPRSMSSANSHYGTPGTIYPLPPNYFIY